MVIRLQAPLANVSPGSTWTRNPVPSDHAKHLTFALVGFPMDNRSALQLATLLRQQLQRWYPGIIEKDSSKAAILIVNGDIAHHSILNDENRYNQKILVLSSSPVDADLLTAAQKLSLNGGFCLVTLKPVGPHALARLVSKMVDPSITRSPLQQKRIPAPPEESPSSSASRLAPPVSTSPKRG